MREIIALLLGGVFLVAGCAKVMDVRGTRRAVHELGFPARLGLPLAAGLPLVELAVAVGLVRPTTSRGAAAVAAALLASFAVVIGISVLRGRTVSCACFGRLHAGDAGVPAVARNGALALAALWLAATPAAPVGWLELGLAGGIAAVLAQGVLSWTLFRRYGQALNRIDELASDAPRRALEVGAEAPSFELSDVRGTTVALSDLLAVGRPVFLAFVATGCAPCRELFPDLRRWQDDLAERVTVVVASRGTIEENRALATIYDVEAILVAETQETFERYGIRMTPSAVLVGSDGHVTSPIAEGFDAIRALVASEVEDAAQTTGRSRTSAPLRRAVAATSGAALAVAASASASPRQTEDPEVEAFRETIASASPGLAKASARAFEAVRKVIVFQGGSRARARRARAAAGLAARLLDAERAKLLELRHRLEGLPATSARAHNVKVTALRGLSLLADSVATRKRAVIGTGAARERLFAVSNELHQRAFETITTSARLIAGVS